MIEQTYRSTGTQAIDRAMAVLACFGHDTPELGITDLANRLDLSPSTVHRIVRALVDHRFLGQDPTSGRYQLGSAMVLLGQTALERFGLPQARRHLERLRDVTGESANLGIRDDDAMLVLARVSSTNALRFEREPGDRVPLHATSMGKAVLAFSEDGEDVIRRLDAAHALERYTPTTLTTADELIAELERIRSRGYSTDEEESIPGVRCVGAPVFDATGTAQAAIAIQAPAIRLPPERVEELIEPVRATAADIAESMGLRDLATQR